MDPYTPRTRPVGRKKNLALSTKEYSKVRRSGKILQPVVFDSRHHRSQERSHLQDGAVIWNTVSKMNVTDAVDTISFPKVQTNVLVRHLLALITIRSFIHCGDVLRQSAAELTSPIVFTHHTEGSWERKIARGEPGKCIPRYSRSSDLGGLALRSNGKWFHLLRSAMHTTHTQGIEGTHITYHPDYSIEDDDLVRGIKFAVSSALGRSPLFYLVSAIMC